MPRGEQTAFVGYITNTLDALIVFEACRRGILPRAQNRLSESQRKAIKSGDVYVFSEEESKIKRWTDGRRWSPSRILNNFLIYRELDAQDFANPSSPPFRSRAGQTVVVSGLPAEADPWPASASAADPNIVSASTDAVCDAHQAVSCLECSDEQSNQEAYEQRNLNGGSNRSRDSDFIKKTISIAGLHMISYYNAADPKEGRLRSPSNIPELASLEINHTLLLARYFRHPPQVKIEDDGVPRFAGLTDDEPMVRRASTPRWPKLELESGSAHHLGGEDIYMPSPRKLPAIITTSRSPSRSEPSPSTLEAIPSGGSRASSSNHSDRRGSTILHQGGKELSRPASSTSESSEALESASRTRMTSLGSLSHEPSYRILPRLSPGFVTGGNLPRQPSPRSQPYPLPDVLHPLLHRARTDTAYTPGLGRHLRSYSISSDPVTPSSAFSSMASSSIFPMASGSIEPYWSPHTVPQPLLNGSEGSTSVMEEASMLSPATGTRTGIMPVDYRRRASQPYSAVSVQRGYDSVFTPSVPPSSSGYQSVVWQGQPPLRPTYLPVHGSRPQTSQASFASVVPRPYPNQDYPTLVSPVGIPQAMQLQPAGGYDSTSGTFQSSAPSSYFDVYESTRYHSLPNESQFETHAAHTMRSYNNFGPQFDYSSNITKQSLPTASTPQNSLLVYDLEAEPTQAQETRSYRASVEDVPQQWSCQSTGPPLSHDNDQKPTTSFGSITGQS